MTNEVHYYDLQKSIEYKLFKADNQSMKRDRMDLIIEILAAVREPVKTHLLFHTNMNWTVVNLPEYQQHSNKKD